MLLKTKKTTKEYLNENLMQNWVRYAWDGCSKYNDQFGCSIVRNGKDGSYTLYHKGLLLINVLSINAAKEIARIYLNDLVANNGREPRKQDTKTKK